MELKRTEREFIHDPIISDLREMDTRPMKISPPSIQTESRTLAGLINDPTAAQAFLKETGICATCKHLAYCSLRTKGKPVNFFCEEYQ